MPTDRSDQAIAARMADAFRRIGRERMAGIAVSNPALEVEVVGARRWQGLWLGILITPWCMNLVLLPGEAEGVGQERIFHRFPSGDYAFLPGCEPEIGEYHSCALLSPLFQFATQDSARATAEAALAALMSPTPAAAMQDKPERDEISLRAPLSRRGFLTGGLFRS